MFLFPGYWDKSKNRVIIDRKNRGSFINYLAGSMGNFTPEHCYEWPVFDFYCKNKCLGLKPEERIQIAMQFYDSLYGIIDAYARTQSSMNRECLSKAPYINFRYKEPVPVGVQRMVGNGSWPKSRPPLSYKRLMPPPVCLTLPCKPPKGTVYIYPRFYQAHNNIEMYPPCRK